MMQLTTLVFIWQNPLAIFIHKLIVNHFVFKIHQMSNKLWTNFGEGLNLVLVDKFIIFEHYKSPQSARQKFY